MQRAGMAAMQGRRRASAGGIAPGTPLLDYADLAIGRTTEGSYLASGQTAAWHAIDTLRTGARGTLVERSHVNYASRSVHLESVWAALNSSTLTAGSTSAGSAPDGTTAASMSMGATAIAILQQTISAASVPNGTLVFFGFWGQRVSGSGDLRFAITKKDAAVDTGNITLTDDWAFYGRLVDVGTGAGNLIYRLQNSAAGAAQVFRIWGACAWGSRYPLTPTRSVSAVFTSGADDLTALAAQVPLIMREGAWAIDVTPEWAPSDLVSGDERWIASFGGSGAGLRFRHTGTDVRVEAVSGGSVVASSNAVTGSTRLVQRTITVNPAAATIDVDGSTGSAGTPWTWPGGVGARVGGIVAAANEIDAYLSVPRAA